MGEIGEVGEVGERGRRVARKMVGVADEEEDPLSYAYVGVRVGQWDLTAKVRPAGYVSTNIYIIFSV